jgi:NAD(P)-dependent dehydrogenase (short-subunit alcohol dehydrogenase family)
MSDEGHIKPVIILTGAGNGIGYHMLIALVARGYRVGAIDIQIDSLVELTRKYPNHLLPIQCSVSDEDQVNTAVQRIFQTWSRIDILVNNACLVIYQPFEERTPESIRQEFEVNYFGYLNLIRAVLPVMKSQGSGLIHNVSSGIGITGHSSLLGYTSTKGAVEAATRTLAFELAAYGITVNLIHPPLTATLSTSAFGYPGGILAQPERVGEKLARKIESRQSNITPDFYTAIYLFFATHFPNTLGNLFSIISTHFANK